MKNTFLHQSEQLYRLLLRLYPEKFKRQFGDEMAFVFSESLRDAYEQHGGKGVLGLWCWTFLDLVTSLLTEHWQDGKDDHTVNPMERLVAEAGVGELRQPSVRRQTYELRADNELVGTLHWPSAFRSRCVAETIDGSWTFERQGYWNSRASTRAAGSDQDLLTFKPNWTGMSGTLEHLDGRVFKLQTNMWCNRFTLMQTLAHGEEVELLAVTVNLSILRGSADVAMKPQLAQTEDAALLAMFSCYLVLMAYADMNNMTNATVTTASAVAV
jgi:hypothetical protein